MVGCLVGWLVVWLVDAYQKLKVVWGVFCLFFDVVCLIELFQLTGKLLQRLSHALLCDLCFPWAIEIVKELLHLMSHVDVSPVTFMVYMGLAQEKQTKPHRCLFGLCFPFFQFFS